MQTRNEIISDCLILMNQMIESGFRFSAIHNPVDKRVNIVSATCCDQIKNKFPQFNIYLNGKDKMVERVFEYGNGSAK